jgi:hypothetical protein
MCARAIEKGAVVVEISAGIVSGIKIRWYEAAMKARNRSFEGNIIAYAMVLMLLLRCSAV